MREDLVHPATGWRITDWIRDWPLDIDDLHASLSTPVSAAKLYGLDAEETREFIRRCLRSVLDAGAVPVVVQMEGNFLYARTDRYGTARDEIVESVIADWQARGSPKLEWEDYAFTMPENLTIFR